MSHERSATIERDGRYLNVNGVTRRPLPPRFPFESRDYLSEQAAGAAAERRSSLEGRLDPWPFSAIEALGSGALQQILAAALARKR